jgi:hypothetical protein
VGLGPYGQAAPLPQESLKEKITAVPEIKKNYYNLKKAVPENNCQCHNHILAQSVQVKWQ